MFDYSTRVIAAILLLCLAALLPILRRVVYVGFRLPSVNSARDEVTVYQKRFHLLKRALPRRGVVGYIGHHRPGSKAYRLTQYAFAPLLVDDSSNHPLVIGDFDGAADDCSQCRNKDLILIYHFGEGVCLFRNG